VYNSTELEYLIKLSLETGIISQEEKDKVDSILCNVNLSEVIMDKHEIQHIRDNGIRGINNMNESIVRRYCLDIFEKRLENSMNNDTKKSSVKKIIK
jgi:hypothetical protein